MISRDVLYQDIEAVCRLTNALYGCYTKLHDYDEDGCPTQLPSFIENAQQLMGEKAGLYLYEAGILRQQKGGNYDFKFSQDVTDGGGVSYNNIGSKDGHDYKMVYFFDDQNLEDFHNIYHELGHLMQFRFNLFNTKQINSIYRFMSKGIGDKRTSIKDISRRFINTCSYSEYLMEAHANAFSNACLLLRAKDDKERAKISFNCRVRDGSLFFKALYDDQKDYPGLKYYASLPIQKAIIKDVNNWFKTGEVAKYKNSDGSLDFDALALQVQRVVLHNAYSPRTFRQFLDMDFCASHAQWEKGWRHYIPEAAVMRFFKRCDYKTRQSIFERTDFHDKLEENRHFPDFKPLPEKDEAAKLLNLCCQLDDTLIELTNNAYQLDVDISLYDELDLDRAIFYGGLPDSTVTLISDRITAEHRLKQGEAEIFLKTYQKQLNTLLKRDYNADTVCDIMGAMNIPQRRDRLWDMYFERLDNPNARIFPKELGCPLEKKSPKALLKQETRLFKDIRKIIMGNITVQERRVTDADLNRLRLHILDTARSDPDKLQRPEFALEALNCISTDPSVKIRHKKQVVESLNKLHTLYFMDQNMFSRTINKYYNALTSFQNNTAKTLSVPARKIER